MKHAMEILASVFSFAGGTVLSIDALMTRKRIRTRAGANSLEQALNDIHVPARDEKGNPLANPENWEVWLAARSVRYAWIGFLLMAIGFLMDLVTKICSGA